MFLVAYKMNFIAEQEREVFQNSQHRKQPIAAVSAAVEDPKKVKKTPKLQ